MLVDEDKKMSKLLPVTQGLLFVPHPQSKLTSSSSTRHDVLHFMHETIIRLPTFIQNFPSSTRMPGLLRHFLRISYFVPTPHQQWRARELVSFRATACPRAGPQYGVSGTYAAKVPQMRLSGTLSRGLHLASDSCRCSTLQAETGLMFACELRLCAPIVGEVEVCIGK